jgi:two-component system response regulator AtoC
MITVSPQMLALFEVMQRVAKSSASVLIRGESGTGKELVAKALHNLSRRASHRFRAINCATLTPDLLASELFGHVRGSFTGAIKDRQGLFSLAHQGTLFLDEVAEIPLQIQGQLLRVLQEHTFTPVGGSEPLTVDVRILSATNKALREEVQGGRFREDLMYRVRVVPLFLPRLSDREGDVDALTWHFIDAFNQREERNITGIDPVALEAMRAYDWPGNVRELRNNIEYAFAIGQGPTLTLQDLTPELRGEQPIGANTLTALHPEGSATAAASLTLHRWSQLLTALDAAHGNRSLAAQALGISRSTLWRRLREGPPKGE